MFMVYMLGAEDWCCVHNTNWWFKVVYVVSQIKNLDDKSEWI